MSNRYYRIGEVSKITGISKDTLHFYSKIGLLVPEYTNPDSGYAYYSHRNLWQLWICTISISQKEQENFAQTNEIHKYGDYCRMEVLQQSLFVQL